jgi:hypothetical protein
VGVGSLLNEIGIAANMTSDGCAQITLQLYYECSQPHIGDHFQQRRQKAAKSYYPLSPSDPSYHEEVCFVGRHSSKYRGRKHDRIIVFIFLLSHYFLFFYSTSLPPFLLPFFLLSIRTGKFCMQDAQGPGRCMIWIDSIRQQCTTGNVANASFWG